MSQIAGVAGVNGEGTGETKNLYIASLRQKRRTSFKNYEYGVRSSETVMADCCSFIRFHLMQKLSLTESVRNAAELHCFVKTI